MAKQEFQATQGLLHDDMRKQAGRIEKALLEAVMNSVDAGADWVKVEVSEDTITIRDNGSGMTEIEIDKYFKNFGFKDDDVEEKTFGRFRRGRGQIFNFGVNIWHTKDNVLVVNLEEDETTLNLDADVSEDDEGVKEVNGDQVTLNTSGLSYNHQKSNEKYDGTHIVLELFKELESVSEKVSEFKRLVRFIPWLHDISIEVNGEKVSTDFHSDFETEYGFMQYGDKSLFADAAVYNLGAYVDDISVKDEEGNRVPVSGVIISKEELDLNNARTEIIEGDPVWDQLKDDYIEGAKLDISRRDNIEPKEAKWLISQASNDDQLLERIIDRELVEDIDGNSLTLKELTESNFAFAPEGNAIAREAMERKGIIMVDDSFSKELRALADSRDESGDMNKPKSYEDVVDEEMQYEMKERSEGNLSKRRAENLQKVRWFLKDIDCYDTVSPGFSKHENVWKDDEGKILVDEDFLNANKNRFTTVVLDRVVEIAAADQDTRGGLEKGSSYYRKYYRYMSKATTARQQLIVGSADWDSTPRLG